MPAIRKSLLVDDPILPPKDAAKYLGISVDSLVKWNVPGKVRLRRSPSGKHDRYGWRRSALNAWLESLEDKGHKIAVGL